MADPVFKKDAILTYEDYLSLPDDRNRYEILEGDLVVTPAPSPKHQMVSANLEFILLSHVKENKAGLILNAPIDVILNESTIVQPDIIFISGERREIITERGIEAAPDLVVEILSPGSSKFDRISKFQIYAKRGVRWYWIVNPDDETLEEYELVERAYRRTGSLVGKQIFEPALFPGLAIDLSEVWAKTEDC